MRVKLFWVERDFRGSELSKREEILHGESTKKPTRNLVARLIARHHPELQFAEPGDSCGRIGAGIQVVRQSKPNDFKPLGYVYAEPLEDVPTTLHSVYAREPLMTANPFSSFSLLLPDDVVEDHENTVASYWKKGDSCLLQVSSFGKTQGRKFLPHSGCPTGWKRAEHGNRSTCPDRFAVAKPSPHRPLPNSCL